jgi:hypothetical protein
MAKVPAVADLAGGELSLCETFRIEAQGHRLLDVLKHWRVVELSWVVGRHTAAGWPDPTRRIASRPGDDSYRKKKPRRMAGAS